MPAAKTNLNKNLIINQVSWMIKSPIMNSNIKGKNLKIRPIAIMISK